MTLEWIRSKGDISDLERYRHEKTFVEETNLYRGKPENNISLVNGDPGMGKSELLKNVKNNCGVDFWCVFLQSMDITLLCTRLEQTQLDLREQELVKFIIDIIYDGYPEFDKHVIKLLIEKYQVAYFWDALDEITTKNVEFVTDLIQELSQKSCFQWITSRCHLKKQLEKKFNVLSRSVSQFSEAEQTLYIHKRLKDLLSDEDIDKVIEKIRSTVTLVKHNDVLGTPLQVFMLTELFRQDHAMYDDLLDKLFSLTDLYQHIIDEKFNRYYQLKADVRAPNDILKQVLIDHKRLMLEKYEKAGLKALIKKEVFRHLNIECDDFLNEIQNRADSIGLITEVTDSFPQFLHNSYAEFFVAKYFTEHYKEIEDFEKIIFDSRYVNVRFFFDLLTAKDSSAHIAVLYKNIDLLKQHKDDLMGCEDTGGRNVLQLACSWGQRCPTLEMERQEEIYIVDNESDDLSNAETSEYTEMLQYLLDNCDASDSDDIFNGTSLAYAQKADCLLAKLKLLLKHSSSKLKSNSENISILYYSAKFGYEDVIDLFEELPFVKTKKDGFSLFHLAVNYGHEKYLMKLLSVDNYKKLVDDRDKNGETPLYEACQNGYYNLAVLLVDHGANINVGTNEGSTPLHTACLHLHTSIVKFLLQSGGNVNITKKYGITPLHVACWSGHHDVVSLLLQNDANINLPTDDGCTPLYIASRNRHDKVASLLLKYGADINFAQEDGATPLFIACQEGHIKNVEVLLKAKADFNLATKSGESPLYIACQNGHIDVVRMLINSGADVNAVAANGFMAIHIACQQGYVVIVQLLIGAGAKVDICGDGMTPLKIALIHGHDNIVALLQN
ncbi:hypothetical protein Zmor_014585 [Zophobas morio]|uniref:Ankyrin repeat domain-containing protein 50 n=1 Tax=Zophobas morio TaxID=2755281 RepID=A0AA38IKZ6_9CUCU|nr:hypothetical protein Zmor_014585 [Zophobas morio]